MDLTREIEKSLERQDQVATEINVINESIQQKKIAKENYNKAQNNVNDKRITLFIDAFIMTSLIIGLSCNLPAFLFKSFLMGILNGLVISLQINSYLKKTKESRKVIEKFNKVENNSDIKYLEIEKEELNKKLNDNIKTTNYLLQEEKEKQKLINNGKKYVIPEMVIEKKEHIKRK